MLTRCNLAEKASAKPKNKIGTAISGSIIPKTPKPEENSPIPNILKRFSIALSANNTEMMIQITVPINTVIRNLNAKEIRSFSDDSPKLLYIAIFAVSDCNNLLAVSTTATRINSAAIR